MISTNLNLEPNLKPLSGEKKAIIPIERYRALAKDYSSSDERIMERLKYLEEFCRTIARDELDTYVKKTKTAK